MSDGKTTAVALYMTETARGMYNQVVNLRAACKAQIARYVRYNEGLGQNPALLAKTRYLSHVFDCESEAWFLHMLEDADATIWELPTKVLNILVVVRSQVAHFYAPRHSGPMYGINLS